MRDLVSIVLPVYNGERFLAESIESIINQTYQNWELIIIDDCSSDSSPEIAKGFVSKDHRIIYYRNEKNLKLPRSLNRGFSLAKGDYLTWTSDDNRYLPDAISKMVSELKNNSASFVFASCNVIDENGEINDSYIVNEDCVKAIIGNNTVGACFMYSRKEYIICGDYNPDLVLVEDFDYWQRIVSHAKVVTISDILYEYRFHDGALTSTMKKDLFYKNMLIMLRNNKSLFSKIDWEQKYYYYTSVNKCLKELNRTNSDYGKYVFYSCVYFVRFQSINKLKRFFKIQNKSE